MSLGPMEAMFATTELLRKHRNADFDDEENRKKAKQDDEDREFKMGERKRLLDTRTELERAAAPATVEPGIYQPEVDDDGNAMPANPSRAGVVNGQGYATMADVDKATRAYNSPEAVTARMSDVLTRRADPETAQKLRTGAMNEKVAGLKLTGAEREEAQAVYLENLHKSVPFGDWNAAAGFMNRSTISPTQGRFEASPDGKKQLMQTQKPDGSWQTTAEFDNTPEGFLELAMRLERVPTDKLLAHLDRKQARADNQNYRAEMLKDKDEAAKQRDKEFQWRMQDRIDARNARAAGAGGQGGGEIDPEAKLKDRRDALADFDKLLPPIEDDADDAARGTRTQLLAQADSIFQRNAEAGTTLTAPQIRAAMAQAADPSKRKVIRDADTGEMFEAVIVNGRPVIVGAVRGQQAGGAPSVKPGERAVPTPAATQQRAAPAPQPPARTPSMREVFELTQRLEQEARAKAEAAKREQAMRRQVSGTPLTADDVALTQRFVGVR